MGDTIINLLFAITPENMLKAVHEVAMAVNEMEQTGNIDLA